MAAVWGMVRFDRVKANAKDGIKMEEAMQPYKIDRYDTKTNKNVIMGCGHQYITKESVKEVLPVFLKDKGIYYTADCMLDNRGQLIKLLELKTKTVSDGELLYLAYEKWGTQFTDYVLGIFTFVIYHASENLCYLFTDHTGSRCLYYYFEQETLYFSTVVAPILTAVSKSKIKVNEKWMVGCEATHSPDMIIFNGLTPFEGVYQLEAGHYLLVEPTKYGQKVKKSRQKKMVYCNKIIEATKQEYWRPHYVKRNWHKKKQKDWKEEFLSTFKTCVGSVLRSHGNTAITLSSGLDSSSVACVAASMLGKQGKKLYSYTSVPIPDYKGGKEPYCITDESEGVKVIQQAYKNIVSEFVTCSDKNAYTEMSRLVKLLEVPYKSGQNLVWLDEIYEKAAKRNGRIVLKGQYGNSTISYGTILTRVFHDLTHARWISAYLELTSFCKRNHVPRKKAIKLLLREIKEKMAPNCETFHSSVVKKSLLKKYSIQKEINRILKSSGGTYMDTRRQRINFMYYLQGLAQIGAYDTKFGLIHGVIIRDPTKDIRMIQLCASLPMSCYVQKGVERAMVRQYMRGIVPDQILDVVKQRGVQSADFSTRINRDWNKVGKSIMETLRNPKLFHYVDQEEWEKLIQKIKDCPTKEQETEIAHAMILCSCSIFLNQYSIE